MSKYGNKIVSEAAEKAFKQVDPFYYEAFEELCSDIEDLDFSKFSFGNNKNYWNVVANILEGNIVKYDSFEEYGRMVFDNKLDDNTLKNFFNYRAYGEELRLTLDEEETANLLSEGRNGETYLYSDEKDKENETLAQNYIKKNGGIKSLDSEVYESHFDFKAFSESEISWARECGDVMTVGDTVYDLSDFDCGLGKDLEKNMAAEVKHEKAHSNKSHDEI